MRNNLSKIVFTAFIAVLLSIISCDATGNPSALIGRWICVSCKDNDVKKDVIVELLSDGTGIITQGSINDLIFDNVMERSRKGVVITWKTEKGRFYSTESGFTEAKNYKLQGSLLTFTKDNGNINEYTKCHNDCIESLDEYRKAKAIADAKAKFAKVKKGSGSFTDSRDGKSYKKVKLDNQTWMAENLNYAVDGSKCYGEGGKVIVGFEDGNDIYKTLSNAEIQDNCKKYGRLYNWETALNVCPKGWHLPSNAEWQILMDLVDGEENAGNILKSSNDLDGVDAVGFSALRGGAGSSDGRFCCVGSNDNFGNWWSVGDGNSNKACSRSVGLGSKIYLFCKEENKSDLLSVRCIMD